MDARCVSLGSSTDMRLKQFLKSQVNKEQTVAKFADMHKMHTDAPVGIGATPPVFHLVPDVHMREFSTVRTGLPAALSQPRA